MTRITESELILPTLHLLSLEGDLNTTELIGFLRDLLRPSGEDLTILSGRNDDKFSQKVRNLTSHDTLLSKGLVTKEDVSGGRKSVFSITRKGTYLYLDKKADLDSLFSFSLKDTGRIFSEMMENKGLTVLTENPMILEGGVVGKRVTKVRKRSRALRDAAVEFYTDNGHIKCNSCFFEFNRMYGDIAKNYIEIHHVKPICEYDGEVEVDLESAIRNVAPLCANCHRVVHLHNPALSIEKVKSEVDYRFSQHTYR